MTMKYYTPTPLSFCRTDGEAVTDVKNLDLFALRSWDIGALACGFFVTLRMTIRQRKAPTGYPVGEKI